MSSPEDGNIVVRIELVIPTGGAAPRVAVNTVNEMFAGTQSIEWPNGIDPVQVKVNSMYPSQGVICCRGTAFRSSPPHNNIAVFAKIYQTLPNPIPDQPPCGTPSTFTDALGNWKFTELPGAACASPYGTPNWVVAWVYNGGTLPQNIPRRFIGVCSNQTDSC